MIGRWIDAQDDEVLGRLARVPDRRWVCGGGRLNEHGGCLLAHSYANGNAYGPNGNYRSYDDGEVASRFDRLSRCFGEARIGRLISERARRVLEERKRKVERVVTIYDSIRVPGTDEFLVTRSHVSLNCEPVEEGV